jgi:hypothetical protein
LEEMMNKPAAFIVVENGQTWLRTSAETEEAIRTGFIMETVPLYTGPPKRKPIDTRRITLEMYSDGIDINYKDGYVDGIRFAEKMHGITGGGG